MKAIRLNPRSKPVRAIIQPHKLIPPETAIVGTCEEPSFWFEVITRGNEQIAKGQVMGCKEAFARVRRSSQDRPLSK
jgi:hypothetical protein